MNTNNQPFFRLFNNSINLQQPAAKVCRQQHQNTIFFEQLKGKLFHQIIMVNRNSLAEASPLPIPTRVEIHQLTLSEVYPQLQYLNASVQSPVFLPFPGGKRAGKSNQLQDALANVVSFGESLSRQIDTGLYNSTRK